MLHGGWDGDKTSPFAMRVSPDMAAQGTMASDVAVFQRPDDASKVAVIPLLKENGQKIVFDNDDTYKNVDQLKLGHYIERLDHNVDAFIKQADLVTTTTEFLADEYRKLNDNVVVLPNCVDPDDWGEPLRNDNGKVRIGVVGSVASTGDWKHVKGVLKGLSDDKRVELVVFSLPPKKDEFKTMQEIYKEEFKFWESLNIIWQPFVLQEEYNDTLNELRLDIMIIPREDNYFNRCKSNLKFLEASMCQVPVIAQGFPDKKSPYQTSLNDAAHMIIANNRKEWESALEYLITDKEYRQNMGREAREYVLNNYSIIDNLYKWHDAYNNLFTSGQ